MSAGNCGTVHAQQNVQGVNIDERNRGEGERERMFFEMMGAAESMTLMKGKDSGESNEWKTFLGSTVVLTNWTIDMQCRLDVLEFVISLAKSASC